MAELKIFNDQMGRMVEVSVPPNRIISLVPSQTELLSYLGLEKEVVGITKFCIHPGDWFKEKTRVGGTKMVKHEKIAELKPDLIIGNKEENTEEDIHKLEANYPVWMSDVNTLEEAYGMITSVGDITDREERAGNLVAEIKNAFQKLQPINSLKTAYFIWNGPMMTVGSDTFIDHILSVWGLENVFAAQKRYPETSMEELKQLNPELLLLSSEPFPFKAKHAAYLKKHFPNSIVAIVDGELFSWYGSRLLKTPDYLNKLAETLHLKP